MSYASGTLSGSYFYLLLIINLEMNRFELIVNTFLSLRRFTTLTNWQIGV